MLVSEGADRPVKAAGVSAAASSRGFHAPGFAVQPRRVISETVSGSVAAMERKGFARLVDRLAEGDVLVERTRAGLARARAEGRRIRRPYSLAPIQWEEALRRLAAHGRSSRIASLP